MAGEIRQPIDILALQKYIAKNVPEIKTPLEVKQVFYSSLANLAFHQLTVLENI
jgi:hypothetical protein